MTVYNVQVKVVQEWVIVVIVVVAAASGRGLIAFFRSKKRPKTKFVEKKISTRG